MAKVSLTAIVCVLSLALLGKTVAGRFVNGDCQLQKEIGPCRAFIPRFFYNAQTSKCEPFIYGGCWGNANNFETESLCQSACSGTPPRQKSNYTVYSNTFALGFSFKENFNNKKVRSMTKVLLMTVVCVMTMVLLGKTLGDTSGNDTITVDTCKLPKETGPCKGLFPRFFYNAQNSTCEQFVYGGCWGNDNNFQTESLCQSACVKS
ncbi:kunitz-type U19-barytoxin-Tl1a-like [Ruditapes philippinarum]|uniref:kunitz-type U19-barytoxin-Tl1a-like n=1 Tax=Ruditapes philippinarum TaxID=129788 RepID=UPI00295AD78A|nr:kunitz-type U19-barytoxin-Tl1a-like [Ruditapes philippinarum]